MDLQYFLEMVDLKHRHGSNLRKYHNYWMNSPSTQNFFYWLDHGEGKDLELPKCSRERLDREQVRYLTREERMNYLVTVDVAGKFRWAKNDELVSTDSTRFRDSLRGVVPIEDDAPEFKGNSASASSSSLSSADDSHLVDSDSDSAESSLSSSGDEFDRMEKDDYQSAKLVKRLVHATPGGVLKQLRGKSAKKGDMWIFVRADPICRTAFGSCNFPGRRYVVAFIHRNQRVRRISAFVISPWRPHRSGRIDQDQGWTVKRSGTTQVRSRLPTAAQNAEKETVDTIVRRPPTSAPSFMHCRRKRSTCLASQ